MIKRALTAIIPFCGWFAIIAQYVLLLQNATVGVAEATLRFFSFFTILTNIIVAVTFTKLLFRAGTKTDLTAVTVYIFVVGIIYQIILRPLWDPAGLQKIVDELLHSAIPLLVLCYWFFFQKKTPSLKSVKYWMIYPVLYLAFILVRGSLSGFYPYPFVDLNVLSNGEVAVNCLMIALLFVVLFIGFVLLKRKQKGEL